MESCNRIFITEKQVAHLWKNHCENRYFISDSGYVQIIYTGRKSGADGCDFQDAVFKINGRKIAGDVEIHIRAKQWYRHKHHLDPAYVRVALHVVLWRDSGIKTFDVQGREIPTIYLSQVFGDIVSGQSNGLNLDASIKDRCTRFDPHNDVSKLFPLLKRSGKLRFLIKASAIGAVWKNNDTEQVIYQYLARAMGYSRNTALFEELAQSLPFKLLRSQSIIMDDNAIKSVLIGTANLLPSQRMNLEIERCIDDEERILENIWAVRYHNYMFVKEPWVFHGIRKENMPVRRIVALGILIHRLRNKMLHMGLIDLVWQAYRTGRLAVIIDGILIRDEEYWSWHFDFGMKLMRKSAILGSSRASEIIVNTILPFVYVYGIRTADNHLKDISMQLYLGFPSLEQNYITRYMQALLFSSCSVNLNAVMQQGLIYIFKRYCIYKECQYCPVSSQQTQVLVSHPN